MIEKLTIIICSRRNQIRIFYLQLRKIIMINIKKFSNDWKLDNNYLIMQRSDKYFSLAVKKNINNRQKSSLMIEKLAIIIWSCKGQTSIFLLQLRQIIIIDIKSSLMIEKLTIIICSCKDQISFFLLQLRKIIIIDRKSSLMTEKLTIIICSCKDQISIFHMKLRKIIIFGWKKFINDL